jgi:hypothetical protein
MLKIENLAVSKDLDRAEMTAIVGGSNFFNGGSNVNAMDGFGIGNSQGNYAPVTQVDASSHTDYTSKTVTNTIGALGSVVFGVKQ